MFLNLAYVLQRNKQNNKTKMNFYLLSLFIIELGLSIYLIFETKRTEKIKICDGNCNAVLISEYNNFLGIKNTYLGILTFTILIALEITNFNLNNLLQSILLISSSLYSIYLIYIQKYKLKEFCKICVTLSILTFVTTILHLTIR